MQTNRQRSYLIEMNEENSGARTLAWKKGHAGVQRYVSIPYTNTRIGATSRNKKAIVRKATRSDRFGMF